MLQIFVKNVKKDICCHQVIKLPQDVYNVLLIANSVLSQLQTAYHAWMGIDWLDLVV